MKATTLDELKKLLEENPNEYAANFLDENSFAYYCYSKNAYMDLCEKLEKGQPDKTECDRFNLTEDQWKNGVEMARFAHFFEM